MKEKDLINHLEAEPDAKKDAGEKEDTRKKHKHPKVKSMHESLTLEGLLEDNQVMRALDILRSYNILSS
jgi:hypothetical protein